MRVPHPSLTGSPAILHHPEYGARYAANLKRELPRIPFVPEFHQYAKIGAALMQLHIDYEQQKEYPLQRTGKRPAQLARREDEALER